MARSGAAMEKQDWKKDLKELYRPSGREFSRVTVPPMQFLMVDGRGDPNTAPAYARAVEWLYAVSYPVKFASKKDLGRDYVVYPLEGLWWADDLESFVDGRRENWKWTMMIAQPDWVTPGMIADAMDRAGAKLGDPPPSLRVETFDEGLCLQIMYTGPYKDEGPVIARLHGEVIPRAGLVENGHHHEIYLGDPRRTAPEKLKTIIRQPVRSAG